MSTKKPSDNEIIAEWQLMLKMFKGIDHTSPTAKKEYADLKQLVKNSVLLTPRQVDALCYRCNHYDEYYKPKFQPQEAFDAKSGKK